MVETLNQDINFDNEVAEPALPPQPKPPKTAYEIQAEEWQKRYAEMSDGDKALYEGYSMYNGWGE